MAFLWCESFDKIGNTTNLLLKYPASSGTFSFPSGRLGGNAMQISGTWLCPHAAASTIVLGFAFNFGSDNSSRTDFVKFFEGATLHIEVEWTFGTWTVKRGTTTIATVPDAVIPVNTWHYLEIKIEIGASGSWEIRRNGATLGSASGVNTQNGGTGVATRILLSNGANPAFTVDDVYILDGTGSAPMNNFLGDSLVEAFSPNAAGDFSDFTPSAGSNWQNVNEASQNGDTTYNASSTVGHKDLYQIQDTARAGAVRGLVITAWLRKDDAGARDACITVRSGGTDADSSSIALGNSYQAYMAILATDPNTGSPWTVAALNALQIGAKVLS